MSEIILSVEEMEKTYVGGVHAVRGVSFEVKEGESLAIIGSSGSGKSTVLRCINRLIEPTQGIVRLKGERINTPCLLYTSPSPRDVEESRMPSSA